VAHPWGWSWVEDEYGRRHPQPPDGSTDLIQEYLNALDLPVELAPFADLILTQMGVLSWD